MKTALRRARRRRARDRRRRQRRERVMRALRALVLWLASVAARLRVSIEVGHQRWRGLP